MRIGEACITFSFYGYLASVLTGFTLMAFHGAPPLNLLEIGMLALAGTLGAVGSLCLMESYYRASVAMIAPLQYTQLFWGALASYALWHIVPGPSLITGSAIVIASGLFLLHRDLRGKS
jgi:drug/metabolite transporter (DMT)-like permease